MKYHQVEVINMRYTLFKYYISYLIFLYTFHWTSLKSERFLFTIPHKYHWDEIKLWLHTICSKEYTWNELARINIIFNPNQRQRCNMLGHSRRNRISRRNYFDHIFFPIGSELVFSEVKTRSIKNNVLRSSACLHIDTFFSLNCLYMSSMLTFWCFKV